MINDYIGERAKTIGQFVAETGCTVRQAARYFGVSKSTVHKDITARLMQYDRELYEKVVKVLNRNREERHIRGGLATKLKYLRKTDKSGTIKS